MTAPLISVVIPCYNAAAHIGTALRSVFEQDWPALEVLVVDDGSTDGSAEMVEREFPAVRVLRQRNQGAAAARNLGMRSALGEWIAFLDADDLWLPGKLSAQMRAAQADPDARLLCSGWYVWDGTPEAAAAARAGSGGPATEGPSGWIYPELLLDCSVWTSTVLARRAVLDEAGGFDPALRLGQDYDLWLRVSRLTRIVRIAGGWALYRQHEANSTKRAPAENYHAALIGRALAQWGVRGPDGRAADARAVRRLLAWSWSNFGATHLRTGSAARATGAALRAIRIDWRHAAGWKLLARSLQQRVFGTAGADR